MHAVHFACDLTSLLRQRSSEKKDVYKNVDVINEIYKNRSELKTFSAEVGPEIVPTVIQGF